MAKRASETKPKHGPPRARPKPKPRPKAKAAKPKRGGVQPNPLPPPTLRKSGHWHRKGVVGRPSALTPKLMECAIALLRDGNYRRVTAEAIGISAETFRIWYNKGLADLDSHTDTIEAEFAASVAVAEAEAHISMVGVVTREARLGDVRAALEFLARRYPKEWARADRLTVSGDKDADPIAVSVTHYAPLLDRLAASQGDEGDGNDSTAH